DCHGHSVAGVHIALGLRAIGRIRDDNGLRRSGRKTLGSSVALPTAHGLDRGLGGGNIVEANRHADRVTVLHRHAVGVGADLESGTRYLTILVATKQLQHFSLELGLFVGDIRDDVAKNVERWHAGVTGARDRL